MWADGPGGDGLVAEIVMGEMRSLLRNWWMYLVLVGLVLAAAAVGAELTWFLK
jgi:hypothetical protein